MGDVNGDGFDDVAVIALTAEKRAGRATIVAGADDIATVDLTGDDRILGRINGGGPTQGISAIAPAEDVNGDGAQDYILGGYVAVPDGYDKDERKAHGMAWAVFGKEDGKLGTVDLGKGFDGFTVNGPARGRDRLGMSVAGAGDIDGDGKGDVLIGADNVAAVVDGELKYSRAGGAAVVRGSASTATVYTDPDADVPAATPSASTSSAASAAEARAGSVTASPAVCETGSATPTAPTTSPSTAPASVFTASGPSAEAGERTDRGWWITGDTNGGHGGYAVAARPASAQTSGTLAIGAWAQDTAWALDTWALTQPVVHIAEVNSALVTRVSGADSSSRLGRGVGFVDSFDGTSGPQLVVGADHATGTTPGYATLAPAPAPGTVSPKPRASTPVPDPCTTTTEPAPEDSDTAGPTDSAAPTDSANPSESAGPSASASPSQSASGGPADPSSPSNPGGPDDPGHSDNPGHPGSPGDNNPGNDNGDGGDNPGDNGNGSDNGNGPLPRTGAQLAGMLAAAAALIAGGVAVIIGATRRRNEK
ncbi:hypothetical protein [Brevibacterium rongguiense]|uniref:hypothetical protein n=1 Tax=Brevibacterium rongguiense TaxID=2695267 RepID=UPI002E2A2F55|nr:hypothetical protein [Brevibacterium rongguiense]